MAYLEELLPEFRKGAKIRVLGWDDGKYYYFKNGIVYNQDNKEIKERSLSLLFSNYWELYEEPIDWNYIIKNKCLCWFEDDDKNFKTQGILIGVRYENDYPFIRLVSDIRFAYKHCRPVRRDEVTFYEDRKDE